MKDIFGILGVALVMASMAPYGVAMWRKTVRPHAFSWIIWGTINTVVCAAQVVSGAGAGAWTSASAAVFNFAIGLYALKYGEKNITHADWAVFLCALAAVPLWVLTQNPVYAVMLLSLIDMMGFIPTVRKSWDAPHNEVLATFSIGAVGFAFALFAIDDFSFVNYCYPVTVLALNVVFTAVLLHRRRKIPKMSAA